MSVSRSPIIQQQQSHGKGIGQTLLGLASAIPSPIQPYAAGLNAASNLATGQGGASAAAQIAGIANEQLTKNTGPIQDEDNATPPMDYSHEMGHSDYNPHPQPLEPIAENPNTQYNLSDEDHQHLLDALLARLEELNPELAEQARHDPSILEQLLTRQKGAH